MFGDNIIAIETVNRCIPALLVAVWYFYELTV